MQVLFEQLVDQSSYCFETMQETPISCHRTQDLPDCLYHLSFGRFRPL